MTSETNGGPAENYIKSALLFNKELADKHEQLTAAAMQLVPSNGDRVALLKLIQVVAMDPGIPALLDRSMVQLIGKELANQSVGGLSDGIEAHRIVAAAAIKAHGGTRGCPIWRDSMLQGLPELPTEPTEARTGGEPPAAMSTGATKATLPKEDTWKTDLDALAAIVKKLLESHNQLLLGTDQLAKKLLSECTTMIMRLESRQWETNALWWAQALYSDARGMAYRKMAKGDRLVWMAFDLAEAGPRYVHPGLEAFFTETIRRSKLSIPDKEETLEVRGRSVLNLEDPPQLSDELLNLVGIDAACLPVVKLVSAHGMDSRKLFKDLAEATLTVCNAWSLNDWALQLLREFQLDLWLQEN